MKRNAVFILGFALIMVYLILAAIMLCCLPLVSAFPPRFQPLSVSRQQPPTALWRQALAVLAVLTFYISLSAVWTFIGTLGAAAACWAKRRRWGRAVMKSPVSPPDWPARRWKRC